MKKKLLLFFLFLLFLSHTVIAQNVYIPDPNFKDALLQPSHYLGAEVIDINGDGEIQVSEAEAVDTVAVGDAFVNSSIQDMTGISAFTNLKVLWCYNSNINALDLSQNTNLEELRCQENQITSLQFGGNPNLKTVLCRDNLLTSLDVSQNIGLEELRCQYNDLPNLDLSQNSSIQLIICNNNDLKFLDIRNGNANNINGIDFSNNPDLTCIFVDDKGYWQNHFPLENDSNHHYVETQAECDALGINEFSFQHLKTYPNPVKDNLNFEMSPLFLKRAKGYIIDISGKIIMSFILNNLNTSLQLSQVPPGTYFLQISIEAQKFTKKIIKL